jgi:hypothetical protein
MLAAQAIINAGVFGLLAMMFASYGLLSQPFVILGSLAAMFVVSAIFAKKFGRLPPIIT